MLAIKCLEEFKLGKHMGKSAGHPLSTLKHFRSETENGGLRLYFFSSITLLSYHTDLEVEIFCVVLV